MANRIQYRRDTAANWTTANPVLAAGEPAVETDTKKRKIGDGSTAWTALPYQIDKATADLTYARPRANTVLLLGTSLEAQNGGGSDMVNPPDGPSAISGRGWFHWANAYLGQRLKLVANKGISGSQTVSQLAALPADLANNASDWVFIGGPVNDMANDTASSVTITNLTAMLDLIRASGRRSVMLTAAPSASYNTTARRQAVSDVNRFIRSLQFTRPDVVVVDAWKVLADPATGYPATGMAVDLVHYSDPGAMRIGAEAAKVLASVIPERPYEVLPLIDPRNVIGNPALTGGTGWTTVDTGITAAYSLQEGRWANKATLTISGTTSGTERGIQYVEPISNGRYAVGDVVQASARFKFSGLTPYAGKALCAPYLRIAPRLADSSFPGASAAQSFTTSSGDQINAAPVGVPSSGELVAVTWRTTIPANTTNLYCTFGWIGAASVVVEVSDICVRKV